MIIDCISDLHGYCPKLDGGDLLIIAGDLTARDRSSDWENFFLWLSKQEYKKKIFISGNHDNQAMSQFDWYDAEYLCDSGTEFEALNIWGSPWSLWFNGINPKCTAFTGSEKDLKKKFDLIPDDIDILITHSPPYGILDKTIRNEHVGSKSLAYKIGMMENPPRLWVWGHIHESYGVDFAVRGKHVKMINASYVNERYEPVNKVIRIEL